MRGHHMTSQCITWHHTTQEIASHKMKTHQITSHDMTWHLATNHITSPHVTSQPTAVLHRPLQPTTSKQVTTSPPWNGWRLVHSKNSVWASQWLVTLCTFYRQILSLTYSFFSLKLPPPACPALLVYVFYLNWSRLQMWLLRVQTFQCLETAGDFSWAKSPETIEISKLKLSTYGELTPSWGTRNWDQQM